MRETEANAQYDAFYDGFLGRTLESDPKFPRGHVSSGGVSAMVVRDRFLRAAFRQPVIGMWRSNGEWVRRHTSAATAFVFLTSIAFIATAAVGIVLSGGWTGWSVAAVAFLGYSAMLGDIGHDRIYAKDALDANAALMPTIRDKADFVMKRGRQLLDCAYLNGLQISGSVTTCGEDNDYCTVIDSIPDYTCFKSGGVV